MSGSGFGYLYLLGNLQIMCQFLYRPNLPYSCLAKSSSVLNNPMLLSSAVMDLLDRMLVSAGRQIPGCWVGSLIFPLANAGHTGGLIRQDLKGTCIFVVCLFYGDGLFGWPVSGFIWKQTFSSFLIYFPIS